MCIVFALGRLCVRANMLIRHQTSSASDRAGDRDGSTNLIQRRILVISESKSTGHALRVRPSRHGEVRRDAFERDEREAARTTGEVRVLLKGMLYRARHNEPTETEVERERATYVKEHLLVLEPGSTMRAVRVVRRLLPVRREVVAVDITCANVAEHEGVRGGHVLGET